MNEEEALLDSIVESNRHLDRMRKHWDKTVAEYSRTHRCAVAGCEDVANQGHVCAMHEKRPA